jgi:hypothetical protein
MQLSPVHTAALQNQSECCLILESFTINAPVVVQAYIRKPEFAVCIVPIPIHIVRPNRLRGSMNNFRSKRNNFALIILLAVLLLGIYLGTRPRLAPGQAPLIDVQNIATLRLQFNQDIGKTRLILLASPT